jgi:hypothetical protein
MAAMPAAVRYGSASSKKAGVCAAGADCEPDSLGALWAIALVGGFIAVDVYARVRIAAREVNADKAPVQGLVAAGLGRIACEIDIFANHNLKTNWGFVMCETG